MFVRRSRARRTFRTEYRKGIYRYILSIRQVMIANDQVDPEFARHPRLGVRFDSNIGCNDDAKSFYRRFLDNLPSQSVAFGESIRDIARNQISAAKQLQ